MTKQEMINEVLNDVTLSPTEKLERIEKIKACEKELMDSYVVKLDDDDKPIHPYHSESAYNSEMVEKYEAKYDAFIREDSGLKPIHKVTICSGYDTTTFEIEADNVRLISGDTDYIIADGVRIKLGGFEFVS